jgi:glycosyltransferase involved in cell wall biosynthesis
MKSNELVKATVVVNNFNYEKFLLDCIESVVNQSYQNIEVIIIDDGSTDNSLELLNSRYGKNRLVKVVGKENGGQLSTFNEAKQHVAGDVVFFLDSDDIYKVDYIKEVMDIYLRHKDVDFVNCSIERFFSDGKKEVINKYPVNVKLGYSVVSTLFTREWLGSSTSTISMRSSLLKKLLPMPFEEDWITRADDCLVWGASVFGSNKYYLCKPLVCYRVHSNNNFYGKKMLDVDLYAREIALNKIFNYFLNKVKISNDNIGCLVNLEFKLRGHKNFKVYASILKYQKGFFYKFKKLIKLVIFYILDVKK